MASSKRIQELDQGEVPWGAVNRTAEAYQYWRRRVVSSDYHVFPERLTQKGFQDRARNWKHMKRAAAVIRQLGADPMEYMQAQFIGATTTSYPYPNNTYSERAIAAWKSRVEYDHAESAMEMMKRYAERYPARFDKPLREVVYDNYLPFEDWFRVCHMDPDDIPVGIARNALKQLKDAGVRRVLHEEGYDVVGIESLCQKTLEDGEHQV